jgi:hypothetical protein
VALNKFGIKWTVLERFTSLELVCVFVIIDVLKVELKLGIFKVGGFWESLERGGCFGVLTQVVFI